MIFDTGKRSVLGYGTSAALLIAGISTIAYGSGSTKILEDASTHLNRLNSEYYGGHRQLSGMLKTYMEQNGISSVNGISFKSYDGGELFRKIYHMAENSQELSSGTGSIRASELLENLENSNPKFKTLYNSNAGLRKQYWESVRSVT